MPAPRVQLWTDILFERLMPQRMGATLLGLFATVALVLNVILILGSLSAIGATLTLPGIAGIVLTIGTAVDSNVLIYERMREESHQGRSLVSALEAGFQRAFATIIDSNVTMLIAALALATTAVGVLAGA